MISGRRYFIGLVCGSLAAWPILAAGQNSRPLRTIGVLMGLANDAEAQGRANAFEQGLARRGWVPGQNLRIEYRFAAGDAERMRSFSGELVGLQPDVIVGHSTRVVATLLQATRTIPIVFVVVSDPIGSGFVTSMARPGGNVTGFTNLNASISGKYLSMLKEMSPRLARVAIMYNPDSATEAGAYYLPPFMESARRLNLAPIKAEVHSAAEIETVMATLGASAGGGLLVMPDNFTTLHRELIVSLAARWRVPAIYPYRYFVDEGGLLSYGVDVMDLFRRAPDYVDRILRGARPADLPVQAPTKFELVINLKTARALGLVVPKILLAGADALIE